MKKWMIPAALVAAVAGILFWRSLPRANGHERTEATSPRAPAATAPPRTSPIQPAPTAPAESRQVVARPGQVVMNVTAANDNERAALRRYGEIVARTRMSPEQQEKFRGVLLDLHQVANEAAKAQGEQFRQLQEEYRVSLPGGERGQNADTDNRAAQAFKKADLLPQALKDANAEAYRRMGEFMTSDQVRSVQRGEGNALWALAWYLPLHRVPQ